ncbi:MAG: UDP-N-acetylmuramate--L-alanine ligase [Frankiaceae bacterium]
MIESTGATAAPEQLGAVHFIGIGGAGMSGIARILLARGVRVSGSDAKDSRALAALAALGAHVAVGHEAGHLDGVDSVVVSTAIRESNPELAEARRRGLPILPRAAALASVMSGLRSVAVAGTHGKTTTTSMLTVALQRCGQDPSFAIGGDLGEPGSNAHAGSGPHFIAEADESDGSFLLLSPYAAVVTNVEVDHLDHYADLGEVEAAFHAFVHRIAPDGFLVACADDPGSARLAADAAADGRDVRRYGSAPDADLRLDDVTLVGSSAAYSASWRGTALGKVQLAVPGRHNALNSAAALTAGLGLGLPFELLVAGLANFTGARRRFELKGTAAGVRVIDDYAHHPTEVAAALRAARQVATGGRVIAVFQPHRYSRTAGFSDAFGAALAAADEVVVMEVYSAGEDPIPGVSGATVAHAVPLPPDRVAFEASWLAVAEKVAALARPGDVILTMGAGDVTMLGAEIVQALEQSG